MPARKQSHYEVLGVPRSAKVQDIGRAFNRIMAAARRADAPPLDRKHEALIKDAYETLSDPDRREAYDKTLVVKATRRAGGAALWGAALAVIAGGGAAAWFALRPEAPAAPAVFDVERLLEATKTAVGRVDSLDPSGKETPVALAFAVADGVMLSSCERIPPGALLRLTLGSRKVPATVITTDEKLGVCKLAVTGAGGWPLVLSENEPRQGDRIYATKVNSLGQVALVQGTVKRLHGNPAERMIEVNVPLAPQWAGGPLLDEHGRVLGIARAFEPQVNAQHRRVPRVWIAEAVDAQGPRRRPAEAPAPAPAAPETAAESGEPARRVPKSLEHVPPERIEKLEKAFRPPPTVPDDI